MICKCGGKTQVVDSYWDEPGVRRKRSCSSCGERFTTIEMRVRGPEVRPEPKKKARIHVEPRNETPDAMDFTFKLQRATVAVHSLVAKHKGPTWMSDTAFRDACGFGATSNYLRRLEAVSMNLGLPLCLRRQRHGGVTVRVAEDVI